jgi:hypothetical protein
VSWQDRRSGPKVPHGRTPLAVVRAILRARRWLRRHDAHGESGAGAIRRYLLAQGLAVPSERTIARWLVWHEASGRERWRRPPPPKGWYLPAVAASIAELDSCDIVEGLRLRGARRVEALNILYLWGARVDTLVADRISTDRTMAALWARWKFHGRPAFLQCDNDTVFTGAHAPRAYLGRLVHWCLCVGVVPVFTPPGELGFQAAIEAYNRRWQERVWRRWRHCDLQALQQRSAAFVAAYSRRQQSGARTHPLARHPGQAPTREPRLHRLVLLRRLDEGGGLVLRPTRAGGRSLGAPPSPLRSGRAAPARALLRPAPARPTSPAAARRTSPARALGPLVSNHHLNHPHAKSVHRLPSLGR